MLVAAAAARYGRSAGRDKVGPGWDVHGAAQLLELPIRSPCLLTLLAQRLDQHMRCRT